MTDTNRDVVAKLRRTMRAGCGDHSCEFRKPEGMGTNGGCRCWQHVERAIQAERDALRAEASSERTAREQAEARVREWRPIDTAPTGQDVLIGGGGCPYVHQNKLVKAGNARCWRGLGVTQQPTHWMPLPDPPCEAQP